MRVLAATRKDEIANGQEQAGRGRTNTENTGDGVHGLQLVWFIEGKGDRAGQTTGAVAA